MSNIKLILVSTLIPALAAGLADARPTPDSDPARPPRNGFDRVDTTKEKQCLEDPNITIHVGHRGTFRDGQWVDKIPGAADMCAYWCAPNIFYHQADDGKLELYKCNTGNCGPSGEVTSYSGSVDCNSNKPLVAGYEDLPAY